MGSLDLVNIAKTKDATGQAPALEMAVGLVAGQKEYLL
jgi:hypothetical protein